MKTVHITNGLVAALLGAMVSFAAAATADVSSPVTRKTAVATAQKLAQDSSADSVPAELVNPFNPKAFGEPDPEEQAAIEAAKAAEAATAVKAKPATEAEILRQLAEKITPSGTVTMNGEPMLIFGQKRLRVGDVLTVNHDGKDYKVELTAIQRSTFSLRFNHAELTRRINP